MIGLAFAFALAADPVAAAPAPGVYPVDYDAQVKSHLEMSLKDYGSAIIKEERAPRSAMLNPTDKLFGKKVPTYVACYIVNAKNSYGGYVGFQPYAFAFVDGKLVNTWQYQKAKTKMEESVISKECLLPADPPPQAGQPAS